MFATPIAVAILAALTALAPTVIDVGHTDSPKAYWDETAQNFTLKTDNGSLAAPVSIEETVSWLKADNTWTVPDDEAYRSFGAPGTTYYASPENVGVHWDTKLWQGIGADAGIPIDRFRDATFALDLVDFSGPGEMTMFQDAVNPGESPVIFLASGRPGRQWTPLTAGSHTHLNTVFTRPGLYRLTYRATARLVGGSILASQPQQTTWWVGDERLVATPAPNAPRYPGTVSFDADTLTLTADAPGVAIFFVDGHELAQVPVVDGEARLSVPREEGHYEAQFVSSAGGTWGEVSPPAPWANKPTLEPHELPGVTVTNTIHEGYHEVSVATPEPVHVTGGIYDTPEDTYPTCEFDYVATPAEPAQRYSDYCTDGIFRATVTPHPLVESAPAKAVTFPAGNGQARVTFTEHTEITAGHVDVGPVVENGSVVMRVIDESVHRPDSTVLIVGEKARQTRSGGKMLEPVYDFIGPEGTAFSLLEQSGASQKSQVWPGFSTEHLPLELRQQGWDIEAEKESDTSWFGFLTGPTMLLPGRIENASHIHMNWVFKETGDHVLRVRAINRTTGEATPWEKVTFRVRDGKQQERDRLRVTKGHVDMAFTDGGAYFDIDGVGRRDSGEVTFVVPGGVIPFSQDPNLPWLGFSWSPVGGTVRLARVDGPGTMTVFAPQAFGGREVYLSSDTGGQLLLDGDHGHAHYAFTFSAPGTYDADVVFTGSDGREATLRARFEVGAGAPDTETATENTQKNMPQKVDGGEHTEGLSTLRGGRAVEGKREEKLTPTDVTGPTVKDSPTRAEVSPSRGAVEPEPRARGPRRSGGHIRPSHRSTRENVTRPVQNPAPPTTSQQGSVVQAAVPAPTRFAAGCATGAGAAFLLVGVGLIGVAVGRRQRD